jgi:hypothetical protein
LDLLSRGCTLIVEPNPDGHRLFFVRLLVERALSQGREFRVALGPGAQRTEEYAVHLAGLPLGSILTASSKSLEELNFLALKSSANLVVVPDGDAVALGLGSGARWRNPARLSLLVMRATAQDGGRRPTATLLRTFIRKCLLLTAAARPRVRVRVLRSSWRTTRSALRSVADPVLLSVSPHDRPDLRRALGLAENKYWYAVLGAISERKNVGMVARALIEQPRRPVGLLVAGRIQPSELTKLHELEPHLIMAEVELKIVDRLLTDGELDAMVTAVDCLVLAHSNEGPSALFGKALLAGTRVLTAGARSLRADADRLPGHASWVPLDPGSIAAGMVDAFSAQRPRPTRLGDTGAFADALL